MKNVSSIRRSHANRGTLLEKMIDTTNKQYRRKGVADIRKIPAPVKIIRAKGGRVVGHVQKGEWVDYVGVYEGRAIAFDAKETSSKTSFPLSNLTGHQYELLKSWHGKGAKAFLVVSFVKLKKFYLLPYEVLGEYWEAVKEGGRKSIPHKDFEDRCKEVKSESGYVLHYLK